MLSAKSSEPVIESFPSPPSAERLVSAVNCAAVTPLKSRTLSASLPVTTIAVTAEAAGVGAVVSTAPLARISTSPPALARMAIESAPSVKTFSSLPIIKAETVSNARGSSSSVAASCQLADRPDGRRAVKRPQAGSL